ncbi:MAG: carboxypeptidase-like regulatory domain-containing protein [Planctomycetota bacterium]|jgi:hypothetical protein
MGRVKSPFNRFYLSGLVIVGSVALVAVYLFHPVFINESRAERIDAEAGQDEALETPVEAETDLEPPPTPPPEPEAAVEETGSKSDTTPEQAESVLPESSEAPQETQEPDPEPSPPEVAEKPRKEDPQEAPPALQEPEFTLQGRVFDLRTRIAIKGRLLSVLALDAQDRARSFMAHVGHDDGSFRFADLPDGDYDLFFQAEDYVSKLVPLRVPLEEPFRVDLEESGTIRLKVTDLYSRRLKDVQVRVAGREESLPDPLLIKEVKGYLFVQGLPEGIHELIVEAPGHAPRTLEAEMKRTTMRTYWAVLK